MEPSNGEQYRFFDRAFPAHPGLKRHVFTKPLEEAVIVEIGSRRELHQLNIITRPRPADDPCDVELRGRQCEMCKDGKDPSIELEVVPASYIIERARRGV